MSLKYRPEIDGLRCIAVILVIDPALVMCDESWCYSDLFGTPLYKDSSHLNYEGSKLVGRLYLEKFGNPFFVEKSTEAEKERKKL